MTVDRQPVASGSSNRQKIIAAVFVVILIVIIWQIWGLFRTPSATTTVTTTNTATRTTTPGMPGAPQQVVPQPATLPSQQTMPVMSQREAEMLKMQQDTESRYLSTLNELQMLRLERDIAETNKAIMSAKLDTVTAEKGIVNLLQPPQPPVAQATYARGLAGTPAAPATATTTTVTPVVAQQTTTTTTVEVTPYTVLSVSKLQNRWSAVVGYQGSLFSVMIGDILPPDGSKVISISRTGIILEKNNIRRKISMVPII